MGLRIQNNIEAFNTHRQLTATATQASKSMEKLSSGYRINRAADDAAGLGISEKMRGQIGGLAQADQSSIGAEVGEIAKELKSILDTTEFNGKAVFTNDFSFQVGANDGETISFGATGLSQTVANGGLSNIASISDGSAASVALNTGMLAAISTI